VKEFVMSYQWPVDAEDLPDAIGLMFSWLQRTLETLDVKANS
jgi:hypothetical protein